MNNILTIIPEKIDFVYPTNIDKVAILIIMLAIPSVVGVVWKAFDKNRNARGDAPNIFIMFIAVTLIYLFSYRSLSIKNEISVMEITPKKEFVIMDRKKYEEAIKEKGPIDFSKKIPNSYNVRIGKISLYEHLDLKMGFVTQRYLNEEDSKKESDAFKSWKIYYDIPVGNTFERKVLLDENLGGLKSWSDKVTEENLRAIYNKLTA